MTQQTQIDELIRNSVHEALANLLGLDPAADDLLPKMVGEAFLKIATVADITGQSIPTIYRDCKKGTFPKPVVLGRYSKAWLLSEVRAWMAKKIEARNSGEDAELREPNPHLRRGELSPEELLTVENVAEKKRPPDKARKQRAPPPG
jgi:predicted DNA-binding transcriptional regulator AlpA